MYSLNGAAMNNQPYYQPPPQQGPPLSCNQAPKGVDCCCCKRCNVGGCDLKVLDCGCCFHSVSQNCPQILGLFITVSHENCPFLFRILH